MKSYFEKKRKYFALGLVYVKSIDYICIMIVLINLLPTFSPEFQAKLADFNVFTINVDEFNELCVYSEYEMDSSWYEAIEEILVARGITIES